MTIRTQVEEIVESTPVFDVHTHLYPPAFEGLSLWGIDEVVTYHYLIAELFRSSTMTPAQFWALDKQGQADAIWDALFVRNTPLSEAARGVVCVMTALGLDPTAKDLSQARDYFKSVDLHSHIDNVLKLANVSELVMTNDPFGPVEAPVWQRGFEGDPRFHAALRMDRLINDGAPVGDARKFLDEWIGRMRPLYMAVSLESGFTYPEDSPRTAMLRDVVFPTAREHNLPFAMMIGVVRQINPLLRDAGDGVGVADLRSLEQICRENPDNRFLVTVLSRENQHEFATIARKFGNLMPFGCWWFLNNPSIIREITDERLEMLGTSFIPQHSDARILEQLIYKWRHSRKVIADSLTKSYEELASDGWPVDRSAIVKDVERLFSGNFRHCVSR
jgi:hypothetical protein